MARYNSADIVLAALAASNGADHSPVQIQKLLFLIDKKVSTRIEGPFFNFIPYDYGPFDRTIYDVLDNLSKEGQVDVVSYANLRWHKYRLTLDGQKKGEEVLNTFPFEVRDYFSKLSGFVRSLSFEQLVAVIYNAYPDMKIKSVFANNLAL
ncbi:MAG: hypothetical protein HQK95_03615 [Nitrospirae bacterium]|nr:hypothetical protein [Nitrospirota bacterium]